MIRIIFAFAAIITFASCGKDRYTTAPQLKFIKFEPNTGSNYNSPANSPKVVLEVTDKEGDLGINNNDTARIYIKNTLTLKEDSFDFPDLSLAANKGFKAELYLSLFNVMGGRNLPVSQRPYTDTLHFEIQVKDFGDHKSDVLYTTEPFIYITQ